MDENLLGVAEAARQLGVSKTFAWQLTARGEIPIVRIGRLVRIRPEDLRNFCSQRVEGGYESAPAGTTPARALGGRCVSTSQTSA
jgi:excisionase family DNA binding protein